ncbi:MAG: ribonuclease P protein component 1 [Candidatus Bathyarchaeota archaeon]|jgi:ribonuclease P protein subunit POP4|nr:ribonuclease P protein component 1 [Candidatus Bathyarchaeota archaeon]MDH5732823.1 ribonuclease P protein component 1 [Candidatus Bathyarchaeota archaeon]
MKVTPNLFRQEFVGLDAKVVKSSNPSQTGISGKIIKETRNTLVILHKNLEKIVIKDVAVFHFVMPDGTVVEINGKAIVGRPENRLKKRVRRRW